ncbi:pol polyprotein [Moniliophthora roreri MCA 2997]|uniref:Pol polyprotein n=1 Tax=Moniliophthora roreri (strain MCA 2997) TaxID=1381753 RepID=V2WPC3_MONRO|nr:pol polyprotein [Moniliophthora roreri MCA 2997]
MGDEEKQAVWELQEAIHTAPCLRPVDYHKPLILAVDTLWQAVGFYLYQVNSENPKKKYFNLFGSIGLNEREAQFSQPKREFFGLKMALEATYYTTYGCRDLIIETDASYIKGMLDHPSAGPNATINRWIEAIRKYHFKVVHVKGVIHGPDGLSRPPNGGAMTKRPPINEEDYLDDDNRELIRFRMGDGVLKEPYPFENFKDDIDNRGGYLFELAKCVEDFKDELHEAWLEAKVDEDVRVNILKSRGIERVDMFVQLKVFPPRLTEEWNDDHSYKKKDRSDFAKNLDDRLDDLKK